MLSRTGQSQELLKGPAAYGFLISLATILWWRSEGAVFTIVPLCMGDGASGLFGHLYGRMRLPWNREKTWLGTFSFFIFAVVSSVLMHFFFSWNGWVPVPYQKYADAMPYYASIASVVVTAMMVESLPLRDWDNLTVFITCAMLYQLI